MLNPDPQMKSPCGGRVPSVPRVAIATLGCKLNQFESEAILARFRAAGYEIASPAEDVDVFIVNTCAVTATAESKTRALLRASHRRHPRARLLAVGCMAERAPYELAAMPGVAAVVGTHEKQRLPEFLPDAAQREVTIRVGEATTVREFADHVAVEGLLGRTRAFLKVQDGCSQKCTYCIVPFLRGPGRSLRLTEAVHRAQHLAQLGFVEVVLTGAALGTYGVDLGLKGGLVRLLQELETKSGLRRIRLGSIEPWMVSRELLSTIAQSETLCPHLHLPLQSAADAVLRTMNRRYTVSSIASLLDYALSLRADWCFGTDIIAGFPSEGEAEFRTTFSFLSSSPFAYLHVFAYSPRPGTAAARLSCVVSPSEKKVRVQVLKELDRTLRQRFRARHLGKQVTVLFENRRVGHLLVGRSANYLEVFVDAPDSLAGTLRDVYIQQLHPRGVRGELIT